MIEQASVVERTPLKVQATLQDGLVRVVLRLRDPMDGGIHCRNEADLPEPAALRYLQAHYEGERVFAGELSGLVAEDPFLRFSFRGARGKSLRLSWTDSRGRDDGVSIEIL